MLVEAPVRVLESGVAKTDSLQGDRGPGGPVMCIEGGGGEESPHVEHGELVWPGLGSWNSSGCKGQVQSLSRCIRAQEGGGGCLCTGTGGMPHRGSSSLRTG